MSDWPYPNPIHLSLVGIHATHDAGYTVDRRAGTEEYLFDFFDTPVVLQDGRERRSFAGNVFILYTPGQPQYFRAEAPLTHTWFQASGDGIAECIEQYRIPVNQAIEMPPPEFLASLLKEAHRHTVRKQRNGEDAVAETIRSLFRRLARSLYPSEVAELSPYQKQVLAELHAVRAQVYRDLRRRWSVDDMAALANMSAQRFAVAYRSCFGTSPIDDLIDVRLRHAEMLLRHLPLTVVDAAQYFGFNTGSNFHVLFRERMGRSPRGLAKSGDKSSERLITPSLHDEDLLEVSEAARRVNLLYIQPAGYWSFDRFDDHSVGDDLGKHPRAPFHNTVAPTPGRCGGTALLLDGNSYAVVPDTVVDTAQSYTVSAWLRPDRWGRMTAISLGNFHHGAFYLQFIDSEGGFKFAVTVSERDPFAIYAPSITLSETGVWHHVVGVHDRPAREIRLYVDGKPAGRSRFETPWRADGPVYFGCCQVMDTFMDHWAGGIDDVRLYDRTLCDSEIAVLHSGDCAGRAGKESR